MFSLFDNAWFYRDLFTAEELTSAVTKFTSVPYVAQSDYAISNNRLIIRNSSDFVFPEFLNMTIGGSRNLKISPKFTFERRSDVKSNIELTNSKLLHLLTTTDDNIGNLSNASLHLEMHLRFEGSPISVKFSAFSSNPELIQERALTILPYGATCMGYDPDLKMYDSSDFAQATRQRVERFINMLNLESDIVSKYFLSQYCILKFNSIHTFKVLRQFESASFDYNECSSLVDILLPFSTNAKDILKVSNEFFNIRYGDAVISYYVNLNNNTTIGFSVDDTDYYHDGIGWSNNQQKSYIPEYSQANEKYLIKYVEWLARTSHLATVSGAIPAYALLAHTKDGLNLVVLPVEDKFILSLAPFDLTVKFDGNAKLFSVLGSPEDWMKGKMPIDGDYKLPVVLEKDSSGVGEFKMQAMPPYDLPDPNVYIKKERDRIKKEKAKLKKKKPVTEGSLEDQLNKLVQAGLVLSPGVTADDFLEFDSEEYYLKNPYTQISWNLAKKNSDEVILSPQAFELNSYYLPENEHMESFARICGDRSLKIEISFLRNTPKMI